MTSHSTYSQPTTVESSEFGLHSPEPKHPHLKTQCRNGLLVALFLVITSCSTHYSPKPKGYFRISFPEKTYTLYRSDAPYMFEYPTYSTIVPDTGRIAEPFWINIHFPAHNGVIHCSYKKIEGNLDQMLEDAYTLAYKHKIKSDGIAEKEYSNTEKKVYGLVYDIKGNAASPMQFYLTDSVKHFLRGSLYFKVTPNKDSIAPVVAFISQDITRLIETFEWK